MANMALSLKANCLRISRRLRSSHRRCSVKKVAFKNFAKYTGKHLCQGLFFNKVAGAAQVFSCEFCKIFKNTFLRNASGWLLLKTNAGHISCETIFNISINLNWEFKKKKNTSKPPPFIRSNPSSNSNFSSFVFTVTDI